MHRLQRRSGISLALTGLVGIAFFWLTDPRFGLVGQWNRGDNAIDMVHENFAGTVVGIGGSLLILGIGVYLLRRKTV